MARDDLVVRGEKRQEGINHLSPTSPERSLFWQTSWCSAGRQPVPVLGLPGWRSPNKPPLQLLVVLRPR